jgi:hypothetical protein
MPSLLCPSVPYYRNPTFRPGLAALVELLMGRNYSSHAIGRIFDFVACNGTLEGSLVEEEDMADAEAAFVDALPAIPYDNEVWGEDPEDHPDDADRTTKPVDDEGPFPIEPPDDWPGSSHAGWVMLPPIRGGSEEAEPFEPSPAEWAQACALFREPELFIPSADDLAEMHAHFDQVEPMYGYE